MEKTYSRHERAYQETPACADAAAKMACPSILTRISRLQPRHHAGKPRHCVCRITLNSFFPQIGQQNHMLPSAVLLIFMDMPLVL